MGRVLCECLYPFNEPLVESELPYSLVSSIISNQKAGRTAVWNCWSFWSNRNCSTYLQTHQKHISGCLWITYF